MIIFFAALAYVLVLVFDYLYLSRRKGLPDNYRYKAEAVFSNLFQRSFFVLKFLIPGVGIVKLFPHAFTYAGAYAARGASWWSGSWRDWLVAILALDLLYYLFHLACHRFRFLWFFHQVHHQDTTLNNFTAYRIGIIEAVPVLLFMLPLALLGVPPRVFFFALAMQGLLMGWIHTSAPKGPRWFEFVFNTASHHRVHHIKVPGYGHPNCGGVLIIWDRLFGSFAPERGIAHDFGVKGHALRISPIRDLFCRAFETVDGPFRNPKGSVWDLDWHLALWSLVLLGFAWRYDHARLVPCTAFSFAALVALEFNLFPRSNPAARWLFRAYCVGGLALFGPRIAERYAAIDRSFDMSVTTTAVLLAILYLVMLEERRDLSRPETAR